MGKKFTDEDIYKLERFASNLRKDIDRFEKDSSYIKLTEEQQVIHDKAIEILNRKFSEMVNAKNKKKLNKIIDVKSVLGEHHE